MPKFLSEILENDKSVPNSSNNTVEDIVYVTKAEFEALDTAGNLKENTLYMIDES